MPTPARNHAQEGGEGDNDLFQSDSPNPYNAGDKQPVAAEKSVYTKKYNKEVESIYIFVKEDNKFVSKGKGFLSLESAEVDGKKVAVVVFRYFKRIYFTFYIIYIICRNTMGSKIIEGFLNPGLKKFEKYVKNFKHVASFSFLQKGKSGKLEIGHSKVPFAREDDLKAFETTYNDIITFLGDNKAAENKSEEKK